MAARAANILRSAAHSVEAARNLALTAVDAMDIDPQTVSTAEPGALTLSGHEGEVTVYCMAYTLYTEGAGSNKHSERTFFMQNTSWIYRIISLFAVITVISAGIP